MEKEDQPKQPVAAAPVPVSQPVPAPQPVAAPVAQPQAQPVYQAKPQGPGVFTGYINKVKSIFLNPKSVQEAAPSSIKDSVVFAAMNMGVMSAVTFIVGLITMAASSNADFSGEFFGSLFKFIFLGILFTSIFLSAITGVIYVIALIAKKETKFSDIFSVISLFSLNCLAVSAASIIGVLTIWLTDTDPVLFISLFKSLVTSLVFVYTCMLIVYGIAKTTKLNLFISTATYVLSTIILVFILGRLFTDLYQYFSVSFGGYSGVSASTSISLDALKAAAEKYLNY